MSFLPRSAIVLGAIALIHSASSFAAPLHFGEGRRWIDVPFGNAAQGITLFGRVNRDTKADLVFYNPQRGEAYVALSNGRTFAPPRLFATGLPRFSDSNFQVLMADVNGDGLDDLVVLNRGAAGVPGAATAVVALSNGSNFVFPSNSVWNSSWCASSQTCLAGDINGDGRQDLVAITQDFGTVFTTLSQGDRFGANATWNNHFCIRGETCALADVNGDGKADLILFKPHAQGVEKGNVLIAPSNGSAFVNVRYGHGYFCIDNERCLVGDVNGDKRADIVLVKGWETGASQLEVLVSLSNGTSFINAAPFAWAHPTYLSSVSKTFGEFVLADVTGDGRADLVQTGLISAAQPGGGFRTTGFAVNVYEATTADPAPTPSSNTPSKPVIPGGYSAVEIYNCHPDQHQLYYWNLDKTNGQASSTELIDAMYSESGTCPDPNDAPQRITLTDGHIHTIIAVDPQAIGCEGRNDPSIVGCAVYGANFVGASNGPVCRWIASAQIPSCASSLSGLSRPLSVRVDALSPQDTLTALRQVGVDFSVPASDLRGWISNRYTPYPPVTQALLGLLDGKRLKQPVYLDVIVWQLEHASGAASPRKLEDVDLTRLKAAVTAAYNQRHGTHIERFEELLQ